VCLFTGTPPLIFSFKNYTFAKKNYYSSVHAQDAGAEPEPWLDNPRPYGVPSMLASASGWLASLSTMSASTCGTST
jgi:hypothetical protein